MRMCRRSIFLLLASTLSGQSPFQVIRPPSADTDILAFRNPVPNFEVRDLSGRTWRSADMQGKLTVVQIWGTFCLPCRQEHPALQSFFNKARSMNHVQALSVSVDGDRRGVVSYMKDKGFTFPVIIDSDLQVRLFPEGGLPETWVIGPDGRRADQFKSWTFGRILQEVEKMAMAK